MKQLLLASLGLLTHHLLAQQTNYHFSHTDSTNVPPENIWAVWTDVPNWKQWDKGLQEAILYGDFKLGAKGRLIPDKGPKSRFVISQYDQNTSYTFKTAIPLGTLRVKRSLELKNNRTFFTHEVEFTGPLKKLFGRKMGKRYRALLPEVLADIRKIAEHT